LGIFDYIQSHPLCTKKILSYLRLFCFNCSRLIFTEDKLQSLGQRVTVPTLLEIAEKSINVCPHQECKKMLPEYNFDEDRFYYANKEGTKYPLSNDELFRIFDDIREVDVKLLNLDDRWIHPRNCLIRTLPVSPPSTRPYAFSGDNPGHDDLTLKYIDIIRINNKLKNTVGEKNKQDVVDILAYHIRTLMDNTKGKAKDNQQKRPIKCFKKRLTGKQGLIRGNIEAKRANLNGRTVVGPEALGHVNELVVPIEISKTLTVPVLVTKDNMDWCQSLINQGKVNYVKRGKRNHDLKTKRKETDFSFGPWDRVQRGSAVLKPYYSSLDGKPFELQNGDIILRNGERIEYVQTTQFVCKPGDVIERHMQNGDWVILNRQPTLWKGSMQAKQVRILPGKTFRFNLACTQAFNADYDGDEMNIHLPQSENAISECRELLTLEETFISSQDSKPMVTIKQDTMSGAFRISYGTVKIPKHVFFDVLSWIDTKRVIEKTAHIKRILSDKKSSEPVSKQIKTQIAHTESLIKRAKTEDTRQRHREIIKKLQEQLLTQGSDSVSDAEFYTGHNLLSFLLPNDFDYTNSKNIVSPDKKPVVIERGVFLSGTLTKESLGNVSGSLIHHLSKDYGNKLACDFISELQIFINIWLATYGLTVSLEDCLPSNLNYIESQVNKTILEAYAVMESEQDPEMRELKVSAALNKASGIGQKLASDALKENNNMVIMIKSGSKGSWMNIAQVTGLVGQQFITAQRIQKMWGGRTTSHFRRCGYLSSSPDFVDEKNQTQEQKLEDAIHLLQSRGFIMNPYFKGLTPLEYFFHLGAGREGIVDSATKTATTGYIQRRITKMMEDLKINYLGCVETATNRIIQFSYGGDGLAADKLIATKQGYSLIDISHVVDKLNKDVEHS